VYSLHELSKTANRIQVQLSSWEYSSNSSELKGDRPCLRLLLEESWDVSAEFHDYVSSVVVWFLPPEPVVQQVVQVFLFSVYPIPEIRF